MQEDYFVNLTARARELRPNSKAFILNYFATDGQGFQCYNAMEDLIARPDLILKDENGYNVLHGNAKVVFYDFRLSEARDMYVKGIHLQNTETYFNHCDFFSIAVLDPVIATNGGANGVFIDGVNYRPLLNCHYKTCGEDQNQCCVFSEDADQQYNEGLKLVKLCCSL